MPNLGFPEFEGEWERYKVSDLLDFYSTNSLSWEQLEYDTDQMFNLHYGLIHVGLPTSLNLNKGKLPNIKKEFLPKKYELCKEGDIAFADASEDTNDVAKAIEFTALGNKQVVCGLHTIHGRDNHNITIVGFKGYAFSSPTFHNQIKRIAQGTKIYSISSKNFSECFIGIPSKEEQSKISRLFTLIDERIATQNRIIEKYESLIYGLLDSIVAYPKDDKKYKLGELCEIRSGYSGTQNQMCKGLRVSRIETISNHHINLDKVGYVEPFEKSKTYKLNIGDILFSNINSVEYIGNTAYIDKDYALYHGMNLLRLIPNKTLVNPFYIYCLLNTQRAKNHFKSVCNKAVSQASINQTELSKTPIFIPTISKQENIARLFDILLRKREIERNNLTLFQKQKAYLLKEMFV